MLTISIKVYGLLLYLYPRSFHRKFGEAMVGVFAESCHNTFQQTGQMGIIALWCSTAWDLLASALAEQACCLAASLSTEKTDHRLKALWLPAIFSTALAMALLEVSNGFSPTLVLHGMPLPLNWRWIVSLPLAGALGAHLSRRAGGRGIETTLAATSPAIGLGGCLVVCLSILFAAHSLVHFRIAVLLICILSWGILPGFALLLGTLPFVFSGDGIFKPRTERL